MTKLNQNEEKITLETLYAYLHKSAEEAQKRSEENEKAFKELRESIGGIGNSNGDVAEEYFINSFTKNPQLNGETFHRVISNYKPLEYDDEYDVLMLNGKSIAIIEVKYNVKKNDIAKLLLKAENFRKYLSQYSNHKLYLGMASLSFRKIIENDIIDKGIAVIKQVGDKMVVNNENLKVF